MPAPEEMRPALAAWNTMGGLDWSALPIVCEMYGIREPDVLIAQLVSIRDCQQDRNNGK